MVRTFLAISLPPEERERLVGLVGLLPDHRRKIRPVKAGNLHLTLKFLGDSPRALLHGVAEACRGVASELAPFSLALTGTGVFPSPARPRVLWAGLAGDLERLRELHRRLESALEPLGFPPDPRGFTPHVTLARIKGAVRREELAPFLAAGLRGRAFPVERFTLYSSTLRPQGPIYEELESFGLKC